MASKRPVRKGVSVDSSEKYKLLLQNSSRRNKLLRWDFKVRIRSRSSSTTIRPLSLYRPLRQFHRPQGVDIDHFGYPYIRWFSVILIQCESQQVINYPQLQLSAKTRHGNC
ncbi:conserved hypothetical protein [Trichinella spiralis]|uniref:hypothetical protein n=1 Tax=Trichinella spiralis TaxID=6334 RepID=UPI0001EFE589|nr:conserved hypothetical protein [Trichinella spiralis]